MKCNYNLIKIISALGFTAVLPNFVSAQTTIGGYIEDGIGLLNAVFITAVALAIVALFVGLVRMIVLSQSGQELKEGKQALIYGLVGMFLIVSLWGVALIIRYQFFGDNNVPGASNDRGIIPQLPTASE